MESNCERILIMKTCRFSRWALLACLPLASCTLLSSDLSVTSVTGPPGPVKAAEPWTLGCVVANLGGLKAPATTVRFYYSADGTLDAGDVQIGVDANVPALAPSASYAVTVPGSYAIADSGGLPGTRRIFAVVDPSSVIGDGDRSNNEGSRVVPVLYERLVIDTYKPTGGGQGGTTDTFASLFDAAGEAGAALAEDDNGNLSYFTAARINLIDPDGFAPGAVLYVKVRGALPATTGGYAIRLVLNAPEPYDDSWFFAADNAADAPYEPDGDTTAGVPDTPVTLTIGERHNRYLDAGDTDWFLLVLP
jgi:hypothetical protein